MANRGQQLQYKGGRCVRCGATVQEAEERYGTAKRMFEFDHVDPEKKHPAYANPIRRRISGEQLDELDKCVLLCAQCHAIVHAQGITGQLHLTVAYADKEASQTITGQVVLDLKDGRATFLSAEPVRVVPYYVIVGDEDGEIHFGTELADEGLLQRLLRELSLNRKLLIVRCSDSRPVLVAQHVEEQRVSMEMDVTCRLLRGEFKELDGHETQVWVRNGVAVTADGAVFDQGTITVEMDVL